MSCDLVKWLLILLIKVTPTNYQVSGDVYAVDDETMMLHNFVYDGNGKDTFFWAGSSNRPSSKGYIVPDKNGRTNVLGRQVRNWQCHPFYCRHPFSSFLIFHIV